MSGSDDGAKKKKFAIIGVSSVILVAMVVAVAVGVKHGNGSSESTDGSSGSAGNAGISTSTKAIEALCNPTDYRETCVKSLSSSAGNTSDPKELIKAGFTVAINEIKAAIKNSTTLKELEKDPRAREALKTCEEVMDSSINDLQKSFSHVTEFDISKLDDYVDDLKIWLSGSITYQQTCLDAFNNTSGDAGQKMRDILKTAGELSSNGLAMVSEISSILTSLQIPSLSRRLLTDDPPPEEDYPAWFGGAGGRRLMAANIGRLKADVVVAKDGSGKYKTINEALKDIPVGTNRTFVIHIKEGVYAEYVKLESTMTDVVFVGDGPTKTKITGDKGYTDGLDTYHTATVWVIGDRFMAKDIGFENTAGPDKMQAVALLVESDMAIIYNCQIDGYQDTLYTHSHRQFYRDCTISGTVDFILGDSAAVFQNCKLIVRMPLEDQQNVVTAQGRSDRHQASAIVLQNCTISASKELFPVREMVQSYLGRPWKNLSRTIIMQSQIDDLIDPEGFTPWMGNFGLNTLFYAEFQNRGPGAVTTGRVTWRGIKKITPQHAADFTAGRFIAGNRWILPTGVPYVPGMIAGL